MIVAVWSKIPVKCRELVVWLRNLGAKIIIVRGLTNIWGGNFFTLLFSGAALGMKKCKEVAGRAVWRCEADGPAGRGGWARRSAKGKGQERISGGCVTA